MFFLYFTTAAHRKFGLVLTCVTARYGALLRPPPAGKPENVIIKKKKMAALADGPNTRSVRNA